MALDGTTREVICDFEGPVSFCYSESNSVKEAHEGLFSAVKKGFADVIRSGEKDSYYLQINNENHGMIDVLSCVDPVEDGQIVFLRYWTRKSPEDNVSVGCVVGLGYNASTNCLHREVAVQYITDLHHMLRTDDPLCMYSECYRLFNVCNLVKLLGVCVGAWGSPQKYMQRLWQVSSQHVPQFDPLDECVAAESHWHKKTCHWKERKKG